MSKFFKILLVFGLVFFAKTGFGQKDVIITNAGEEIRCKILDETPTRFKYAYVGPRNKVLRNEIFKNLVSSFKYGYYENDLLKNEKEIVRGAMVPKAIEPKVAEPKNTDQKEEAPKPIQKEEQPKVVQKDEPKKANTPAKVEAKVNAKETANKPATKEIPAKDLARDLNKPSYPVNNQTRPAEPTAKKDEPVLVTNLPIKKDETPVQTNIPVKKEDVAVQNIPAKKEDVKIEVPKVVVEAKTKPVEESKVKKDTKPVVAEPKEIIKPIQKPEIVKAEPKIPEKIIIPNAAVKPSSVPMVEPSKQVEVKEVEKVAVNPTTKTAEKPVETKPAKKEEINVIIAGKSSDKKTQEKMNDAKKGAAANKIAKMDQTNSNAGLKNYMKFRIGIKGGLGNIINKTTDTSPYGLYQEKLQRGWILGGDVSYFMKDWLGLGVKYASFQTNNSSQKLDFTNPASQEAIKSGSLSNKVSHKFIGPTVLIRKSIDFKTNIVLTASPGINLYTDKGTVNANNFKLTGQSYGGNATVGLDFMLGNDIFGRDIILSIEGGYNYGSINKLSVAGSTEKQTVASPINLNRLDFGVGLRFTRFPMYLR